MRVFRLNRWIGGAFVAAMLVIAAASVWASGSAENQSAAASNKPMTITVANYQIEPVEPNAPMIPYFEKQFGVKLKILNIDNQNYDQILNVKLASGEIPDFLYLRDPSTLGTYVKQGVIASLTPELMQKNMPNYLSVLSKYAPGYLDMGKIDGVQYGIPVVSPTNIFRIPLVYRSDWMKKVGVTKAPDTLAEFQDLMYKFANDDPDGNGKKDTYGLSQDGLQAVFGAFGIVPFDKTDYWVMDNGTVINSAVSPKAKQALQILAKWYKDGVLDPEFVTGENEGGYWALSHAFIKGRIGFTTRGNYYHWTMPGVFQLVGTDGSRTPNDPGADAKEVLAANPNATIEFGLPLQGPDGDRGIKQWNRLENFLTVGKLAEKVPGKVAKVLQIFDASANPDPVERLTLKYGTEGKYWKMIDPATETFQFLPPYDKEIGYSDRIGAALQREVPIPPKDAQAQWAFANGFDKYGIASLIQVGLPLMNKYKAELQKIRDEAYIAIITGEKPVSYFDDFVKQYLAAGGDQVQKEANAYYASAHK